MEIILSELTALNSDKISYLRIGFKMTKLELIAIV